MIQPTRFTKGQKVILRKIGKILMRFKTGQMKKKSITNQQIQELVF